MKTVEYLDAIKSKMDITSDYALSKALGVSRQAISRYQKGHGQFDDDVAARAAQILGIHPGIVVLDMHRERAHTPESRALWQTIFEGFYTLLPRANWGGCA